MPAGIDERGMRRAAHVSGQWIADRWRAIISGFWSHRAIHAIAITAYGAGLIQSSLLGDTMALGLAGIANLMLLAAIGTAICVWLAADLVRMWRSNHPGSAGLALMRTLCTDILAPGRVANGFHAILATGLFAIGFTTLKSNIPLINPFLRLGRGLHEARQGAAFRRPPP